jgi:putative adenylate-forming enzyme
VTPRATLALAAAFLRTCALHRWFTTRERIEKWQNWRLARLRRHAVAQIGFYREFGKAPLSAFPVLGKRDVLRHFEAFNLLGLTAPQIWAMIDRAEPPVGYEVGCSTGTSGSRGLYLISDQERFVWLGTIVAKALRTSLWRPQRVAIVLPRMSRLYDAANESKLLKLLFLDLSDGLQAAATALVAFKPTVVVGPPKALRWLAEDRTPISPGLMFSAAEVLDPPDRAVIERHFDLKLREIYMATEGLFAVSCERGTLHLAEDVVHFELEPVDNSTDLVKPIVTDFTRRTQVTARYRMDDILRLDRKRCACGSALQAVTEIIGRSDDVFQVPHQDTSLPSVMLTPDILRNAVLAADPSIDDFRIRQIEQNRIEVVLPLHVSGAVGELARQAVTRACARVLTSPEVTLRREPLPVRTDMKLRRVENCCSSGSP